MRDVLFCQRPDAMMLQVYEKSCAGAAVGVRTSSAAVGRRDTPEQEGGRVCAGLALQQCSGRWGQRGSALVLFAPAGWRAALAQATLFIHKLHCNSSRILNRSFLLLSAWKLGERRKFSCCPCHRVEWTAVIVWLPRRGRQDTPIFLGTFPTPLLFGGWKMSALFFFFRNLIYFQELKRWLLHNKAVTFSS